RHQDHDGVERVARDLFSVGPKVFQGTITVAVNVHLHMSDLMRVNVLLLKKLERILDRESWTTQKCQGGYYTQGKKRFHEVFSTVTDRLHLRLLSTNRDRDDHSWRARQRLLTWIVGRIRCSGH